MAPLRRAPATAADDRATYPSLDAFGDSRRRFLKLCALSSAAATLGLQLVGCPSPGGGGGGTGGGGGGTGGNTDWIPWNEEDVIPLAGAPPIQMGTPVAVVVAGAPIDVVFQDGVKAQIVVAGVVTPMEGTDVKADCTSRATAHTKLVQDTVLQHPSSVLSDAKALDALEAKLMQQLNTNLGGGYMDQVSVAEAKVPESQDTPAEAPAESPAPAPSSGDMAPSAPAAPAPPPAPRLKPRALKAKQIWTPCRRAGCTSCG